MESFYNNLTTMGLIGGVIVFFIIIITFALYLLPTIIASTRHKHQFLAICLINIFAGWTFVGWLVALIWAAMREQSDNTG
jgi:hypothetical protein